MTATLEQLALAHRRGCRFERIASRRRALKPPLLLAAFRGNALRMLLARLGYPRWDRSISAATFWGRQVALPGWDQNAAPIVLYGGLLPAETGLLAWIAHHVGPRDVFIDCGANYGVIAGWVLDTTAAEVHAFEPNGAVRDVLLTWLGGEPRLHVSADALGAEVGECELVIPRWHSGAGRVRNAAGPDLTNGSRICRAAMTTIDRYVAAAAVLPTVLKIDVEGFEPDVLQGARTTLRQHRPRVLMEVHFDAETARPAPAYCNALQILAAEGYRLYRLADDGIPHPSDIEDLVRNTDRPYVNVLLDVATPRP
jgi:FkbM family methyltransferase